MKFWNDYPLLRLLIPMLIGIVWAYYFPLLSLPFLSTFLGLSMLLAWIFRPKRFKQFKLKLISGVLVSILFLFLGMQLVQESKLDNLQYHYSKQEGIKHLLLRINNPLIEKKNSYKTMGQVIGVYQSKDSLMVNAMGKLLIYFEKSSKPSLNYGDEIMISCSGLQEIRNLGNPKEFDYKAYLKRQGISHQIYLTNDNWIPTQNKSPQFFLQVSFKVRGVLLEIIRSFEFENAEFAVASAILLGYDEYLDPDLQQLYSGSGAMHILCVSGLHVGIIFMIFNLLLSPLKRIKHGAIMVSILLMFIIWFYALITGMSPSVFRSATMFSFINIGINLKRKNSSYNSLIASAIVLLITNPLLIFHIGFQLSYAAVLSILLLQPILSRLVKTRYGLVKKIRDLISVSIAAQLGTFPLAIYYFHQFPNYFILTNLIVIPLSFLILITGFASLSIFIVGLGASFLGLFFKQILYYLLYTLNIAIGFISHLPLAISGQLYFNIVDTFLIYLFIIFMLWALIKKQKKHLYIALSVLAILMLYNISIRAPIHQQSKIIIYHIPKSTVIERIDGHNSMIYLDSSSKNTGLYKRYISASQYHSRIKQRSYYSIDSIGFSGESDLKNLLIFNQKTFFILDDRLLIPEKKTIFDYVLIRNNPRISIFELKKYLDFESLIWDGSNKYWHINDWKKECDSLDVNYFDITKKGAFILKGP